MQRKLIISAVVGNLLEFYDFILYGLFAGILAKLFFPHSSPQTGLMATFVVLAVGYFTRPLGGVMFGHFGDRFSRRRTLIFTLLTMGCVTTCIGLLPTTATWGIAATFLLVLLRLLQGVTAGGEMSGSMVFLLEACEGRWRALTTVMSLVGAMVGVLLALAVSNVITSYFSEASILAGAWRIPFLLGIVLAVIGVYLRLKLWPDVVPHPVALPLWQLFRSHTKIIVINVLFLSMPAIFTGLVVVYLVPYLTHYYHLTLAMAMQMELWATIFTGLFLLLGAFLVDVFKCYRAWLLVGSLVLAIVSYPLFLLMQHGEVACVVGLLVFVALASMVMGPEVLFIAGLFDREVRYTGVGLCHGLTFSALTGTAPLVLNLFAMHWGVAAPSLYFVFSCVLAFVAVFFARGCL